MTLYDRWALASPQENDDLERLPGVFNQKVKEAKAVGIVFDPVEINLAYNEASDNIADRGEDSIEQVVEDVLEGYGREVEDAAKPN